MAAQARGNLYMSEGSLERSGGNLSTSEGSWQHASEGSQFLKRRSSSFIDRSLPKPSSFIESVKLPPKESSNRSLGSKLTAAFVDLDHADTPEVYEGTAGFACCKFYLTLVLKSALTDMVMTFIILADLAVGIAEVNSRAYGNAMPEWTRALSSMFLIVYCLELSLTAIIVWPRWCHDSSFLLDAVIISLALLDYIVQALAVDLEELGLVRFLRAFRIVRLLRLFRKAAAFKSLRKLLSMAVSSVRTLMWSFVLCALLLTFWSMASVELLHPLVQKMDDEGKFSACPNCGQAFASVQHAFLTLAKLSMTGEDFGLVAEPLMVEHPWSAILLMGSMLSIVFGVLNMVVAVVIDEFAERRANDFMTRADEMDEELQNDNKRLGQIFKMVDEDGSGEVTLEELQSGAHRVPEFRNTLRWMDIDQADIEQLFDMLDDDGSGEIESAEFVGVLSRWMRDSKTAGRFVRYSLMKFQEEQAEMRQTFVKLFRNLDDQLKLLVKDVSHSKMYARKAPVASNVFVQESHQPAEGLHTKIEHQLDQLQKSYRPQAPLQEFAMEDSNDQLSTVSEMFQNIRDQLRLLSDDLRVAFRAQHREGASTGMAPNVFDMHTAEQAHKESAKTNKGFAPSLYEDTHRLQVVDSSFAEPLRSEHFVQHMDVEDVSEISFVKI